jgi:hypothetical protein
MWMILSRVVFFFLLATSAFAQTFLGNLAGVATDFSGAAFPGANVKPESISRRLTRSATSSANGDFLFVDLPMGTYTLTVGAAGFEMTKIEAVEIPVSKTTDITVQLSVAQQQATVEASAAAVSVDTCRTGCKYHDICQRQYNSDVKQLLIRNVGSVNPFQEQNSARAIRPGGS